MRTFLIRAVLVLVIAGAASQGFASEITVVVTDAHLKPVEKARVTWSYPKELPVVGPGSEYTWSNKEGSATFPNIHPGTHRVRVEKEGFIPVELSEIVFDVKAQKSSNLKVYVVLNPTPREVERQPSRRESERKQ